MNNEGKSDELRLGGSPYLTTIREPGPWRSLVDKALSVFSFAQIAVILVLFLWGFALRVLSLRTYSGWELGLIFLIVVMAPICVLVSRHWENRPHAQDCTKPSDEPTEPGDPGFHPGEDGEAHGGDGG